jgi:hypothetical protein
MRSEKIVWGLKAQQKNWTSNLVFQQGVRKSIRRPIAPCNGTKQTPSRGGTVTAIQLTKFAQII